MMGETQTALEDDEQEMKRKDHASIQISTGMYLSKRDESMTNN